MPASPLPDGDLAFSYFPGNYRWSHGVLIAPGGAAGHMVLEVCQNADRAAW